MAGVHPSRTHVPALDGVRGLAILAVMGFHFTLDMPEASGAERALHRVLGAGWVGVDLFFVLSGLLITSLLLDAKGAPGYFRTFYGRRALRIFPLYYGFLAAYFFLVVRTSTGGEDRYLWSVQGWWWSYLDNWWIAFVRKTEPPNLFWVGPFWSLAVEEQFYLVWPTLVLLLSRRKLAALCLAIIIGAPLLRFALRAAGAAYIAPYALTPARLDSLAVGALLAVLLRDAEASARALRAMRTVGIAAAALVLWIGVRHRGLSTYGSWEEGVGYTVVALGWSALVLTGATAAPGAITASALGARWLRSVGKYSYAMYVFHVPIWSHVRPLLFGGRDVPTVGGSHLPAMLALIAICGALTFLAGFASWHLYERHFLKLKRLLPYETRKSVGMGVALEPGGEISSAGPNVTPIPTPVIKASDHPAPR